VGSHLAAQAQPVTQSYPVVQGNAYKFEQIADGVYYATVTRPGLGSNNVVVVNDTDVLIVDAGTSPAAARAFVEDVKKLTDKPIRYIVNTHWHYDHTAGNQIFGPEVQIIATDHLYQMLATGRRASPRAVLNVTGDHIIGPDRYSEQADRGGGKCAAEGSPAEGFGRCRAP